MKKDKEAQICFKYLSDKYGFEQHRYIEDGDYCIDHLDRCNKIFRTTKREATAEEIAAYTVWKEVFKDFGYKI